MALQQTALKNKPYDEVIEVSQDLSMAESYDGRAKTKERKLTNDMYDEAVEISQSMDQNGQSAVAKDFQNNKNDAKKASGNDTKQSNSQQKPKADQGKNNNAILNRPFDEALDFSRSDSDESVDTRASERNRNKNSKPQSSNVGKGAQGSQQQSSSMQTSTNNGSQSQSHAGTKMEAMPQQQTQVWMYV